MQFDREKGIQAIIDLQAYVGIEEPRERAETNWDKFHPYDQEQTMQAHRAIFPEKYAH